MQQLRTDCLCLGELLLYSSFWIGFWGSFPFLISIDCCLCRHPNGSDKKTSSGVQDSQTTCKHNKSHDGNTFNVITVSL